MSKSLLELAYVFSISYSSITEAMGKHDDSPNPVGKREQRGQAANLYFEDAVAEFLVSVGVVSHPLPEHEVSTTDIAFLLSMSAKSAKVLLNTDKRAPKLIRGEQLCGGYNTLKIYSLDDVLAYRELIGKGKLSKAQLPKRRVLVKTSKVKSSASFNTMAQAFIRAATEIRPRMATCGGIISRVRTEGEWGIGI